jgi:hypothetical protein
MNADVNILYSAVIRRQAILNAGNFDPELRTSEDFHLWARMLMEGAKFAYHRAPLLHYRLRSTSLMAAGLEAQAWLQRALDKLLDLPLARDERAAVSARRMAVQMDMELARGKQALERKDWASARWHLEMYQRYRPNRKLKLVLFVLRVWPQLLALCFGFRNGLLSAGWLKANRPKQAEANS